MRLAALVVCATLTANPALAQTQPLVTPTRDVDVTYKVPVAGGKDMAILQRLRFSAGLRRQRVDLPTSGSWMVLDYVTHHMTLVRDSSHELVDLAAPENAGQPGPATGYLQAGAAQIAGLACTEWRTRDTRGQSTIVCYTPDGVLLRARNDAGVLMEAVDVAYRPQDATIFDLPSGYSHQTPAQ